MINTINTQKVEFAHKVYIEDKKPGENTRMQNDDMDSIIRVIRKSILSSPDGKANEVIYVQVNFEKKKKRAMYQKINRKLGEG